MAIASDDPAARPTEKSAQDLIDRYHVDFGAADEPIVTAHAGAMWHIIALAHLILSELETLLAGTGIGPSDLFVMAVLLIEQDGKLKPSGIARILSVTPAAISLRLAKLDAAGLLERSGDSEDRRIVRVQLTGEGKALTRSLLARAGAEAQISRALNQLDSNRRAALEQTLAELFHAVDRHVVR